MHQFREIQFDFENIIDDSMFDENRKHQLQEHSSISKGIAENIFAQQKDSQIIKDRFSPADTFDNRLVRQYRHQPMFRDFVKRNVLMLKSNRPYQDNEERRI